MRIPKVVPLLIVSLVGALAVGLTAEQGPDDWSPDEAMRGKPYGQIPWNLGMLEPAP
jgi:hypothetical protein